ncbi:MAG TPA: GNAT family N-acetyltransferase [Stellaceae bacterium]|nr:GNAT family N-acetyltransferase [Stellaceae bacterium]
MSGGEGLVVALVDAPSDEARALVAELDGILGAEYPPEQRHGLSLAAIFQPHIRFFVARQGMAPVGCAAVALFADFAEVKRMYVRDAARGGGAAPALLRRLEATAREAGLALLRLETGTRQFAALRFYEREGFRRCPVFGAYAAMPPHAIVTSIFMEKPL